MFDVFNCGPLFTSATLTVARDANVISPHFCNELVGAGDCSWADSGLLALGQLVAKAAYIFGAICPEHGQG